MHCYVFRLPTIGETLHGSIWFLECRLTLSYRSLENQFNSVWNNPNALRANWVLNFSTDILLFVLPFFMISCLKLRKRQKLGLCGIFSLGALTMIISLVRFIEYSVDLNLEDTVGGTSLIA